MEAFIKTSGAQVRDLSHIKREMFNDEKNETITSKEQKKVEKTIEQIFDRFEQYAALDPTLPVLNRKNHANYLEQCIRRFSTSYECLDASRPWLVYWVLNAASILNVRFSAETYDHITDFLKRCRCPEGGFGGGPGQVAHLAPTYAAVNALVTIGTDEAFNAIDKNSLKKFFLSVRESNGAYRMHVGGEVDVRGAYCAISAAKLVNVTKEDEQILFRNTAKWIAECQTYEGGFGGAPGLEAHGGYSFCAAAALAMLGSTSHVDLHALLRWAVNRQTRYEGGFQGRTNKLVDGCYSFWQGALVPVVQALISKEEPELGAFMKRPLFHREALQEYILICCQKPTGGLIDKPGKPADPYHTCYTLSGLSVAQHCDIERGPIVIGDPMNEVLPTHPVHNIPPKAALKCYMYFLHQPETEDEPLEEPEIKTTTNGDRSREASNTTTGTFERFFKSPSMTNDDSENKSNFSTERNTRESSNVTDTSMKSEEEQNDEEMQSNKNSVEDKSSAISSKSDRESSGRSSSWVDVESAENSERDMTSQPRSDYGNDSEN